MIPVQEMVKQLIDKDLIVKEPTGLAAMIDVETGVQVFINVPPLRGLYSGVNFI